MLLLFKDFANLKRLPQVAPEVGNVQDRVEVLSRRTFGISDIYGALGSRTKPAVKTPGGFLEEATPQESARENIYSRRRLGLVA